MSARRRIGTPAVRRHVSPPDSSADRAHIAAAARDPDPACPGPNRASPGPAPPPQSPPSSRTPAPACCRSPLPSGRRLLAGHRCSGRRAVPLPLCRAPRRPGKIRPRQGRIRRHLAGPPSSPSFFQLRRAATAVPANSDPRARTLDLSGEVDFHQVLVPVYFFSILHRIITLHP